MEFQTPGQFLYFRSIDVLGQIILLWRVVLEMISCLAASLASTVRLSVEPAPQSYAQLLRPIMSIDIAQCPSGANAGPVEDHRFRII